jgi:DNA polymerase elongation subunit (family B)
MKKDQFFVYSWKIDKKEQEVTAIRIYGIDDKENNICVRVNNFTPYIYVELPDRIIWTQAKAQIVGNKIDELLGNQRPLEKAFEMKQKLYGVHNDSEGKPKLFPYLKCLFSNRDDAKQLGYRMRRTHHIVGMGAIKFKIHERDADEILQLTCARNLPTAGWIEFMGNEVAEESKVTLCNKEYVCRWKNLGPSDRVNVPDPLVMSFDLEVNSSNPARMPNANMPQDKIFQISCIFRRGGAGKQEDYLLSLGKPDHEGVGKQVTTIEFDTESDLLQGWTKLVREKNPNVIIGYNIFGFDIPYMIERAKALLCLYPFDQQGFHKTQSATEKTIKWSSSAYGKQEFQFLDAEGRLFVDLLPLVQRDYKMANYKLKTISTHFLGETKDPLTHHGIFKCYKLGMVGGATGSKALGICGKYCIQDSVLVLKLFDHLQSWLGLCEMATTCRIPIFGLYTQGQQIRVYSQIYKYCMDNNKVVENDAYTVTDDERYIGAHVFDPVPGVYDKVTPVDFASLYPTTIIAYNIDYSTWVTDPLIPDSKCHVMDWSDHVGCIHDPKVIRRMKLDTIIAAEKAKVKDVRNKRNKTSGALRKKELMDVIKAMELLIKPYTEERSHIMKTKPKFPMCAKRYYRFLKEPRGVMPTVIQNLLDARKHTRIQQKENIKKMKDDPSLVNTLTGLNAVLEKRQLAYKVSANSMYGAMGARKGYLPFMPGAMCTTYMGRVNIEIVAKVIPEKYGGELVYGDTDSNYIHFPHVKTAQEAWDYTEWVAAEVTKLFPAPIKLEFENVVYWRFFILTKKRYMYKECGADGIVSDKIGKKGVLLARRDNSGFVRFVYEKVIMMVFDRVSRDEIITFVMDQLNRLFSGCINPIDFVITKAVGDTGGMNPVPCVNDKNEPRIGLGQYKVKPLPTDKEGREKQFKLKNTDSESGYYTKCLPAHVQLAEKMKDRGQRVDTGSRLEYIICDQVAHTAKQYDKVESIDYFLKHRNALQIDFMSYLKLLAIPLDCVIDLVGTKDKGYKKAVVMEQYDYRLKIRAKVINQIKSLSEPNLVFDD